MIDELNVDWATLTKADMYTIIKQTEEQNAKLREERDMYRDLVGLMDHPDLNVQLQAENARLREMAKGLYEFAYAEHPSAVKAGFADDLRELGVEVGE